MTAKKTQQKKKEKEIAKVVNKVIRQKGLSPEMKFLTTPIVDATVDVAGVQHSLCLIAQGDEFYERNGMQIAVHKIEIDVFLVITGASQTTISNWENPIVGLFIDRQSNGTFPIELTSEGNAVLLVSDAPYIISNSTPSNVGHCLYFRNPLMLPRYRHLMDTNTAFGFQAGDWEYPVDAGTPTYNNVMFRHLRYTKTFKNPVIIQYDDQTATSDCIVKNNFILAVIPVFDEHVNYQALTKLSYTDA